MAARTLKPRLGAQVRTRRLALAGLAIAAGLAGAASPPFAFADDMSAGGTWYSSLAEVDASSVGRLDRLPDVFLRSPNGQAGAPAQDADVLVAQTPFPHAIFAVAPFSGETRERWRFEPPADRMAKGLVCC